MKQKQDSFGLFSILGTILAGVVAYAVVKKLKEADYEGVPSIKGVLNKRTVIKEKKAKRVVTKSKKRAVVKKEKKSVVTASAATLRQKKLFDYIKKNKSLVMSEALGTFKDINERTLRRDLVYMVKKGLIKKHGSTKSTKYVLK